MNKINQILSLESYIIDIENLILLLSVDAELTNYPYLNKIRDPQNKEAFITIRLVNHDGLFIDVVILTYNLFMQGFISNEGIYYYFDDATVKSLGGVSSNQPLGYNSNYSGGLSGTDNTILSYSTFNNAIAFLSKYKNGVSMDKSTLVIVIFIISESIRFSYVKSDVSFLSYAESIPISYNWIGYKDILVNWESFSEIALNNTTDPYIEPLLGTAYVKIN